MLEIYVNIQCGSLEMGPEMCFDSNFKNEISWCFQYDKYVEQKFKIHFKETGMGFSMNIKMCNLSK